MGFYDLVLRKNSTLILACTLVAFGIDRVLEQFQNTVWDAGNAKVSLFNLCSNSYQQQNNHFN